MRIEEEPDEMNVDSFLDLEMEVCSSPFDKSGRIVSNESHGDEESEFFKDYFNESNISSTMSSYVSPKRGESITPAHPVKSELVDDKKYKLYVVPQKQNEIAATCYKLIGCGAIICINKNCQRNHHGGHCPVVPGEAYVLKDKGKVFATPSIDLDLVAPNLSEA